MSRPRYRDYVPPLRGADAHRLRGLPTCWEQHVEESTVDGVKRRAHALALGLRSRSRRREADELLRSLALLERTDDLQRHASTLETLAGLYRALATFAHEPAADDSLVWAQTGALDDAAPAGGHGPAFREMVALRNRAFRSVESALAKYARAFM